jgi:hypothetical protein
MQKKKTRRIKIYNLLTKNNQNTVKILRLYRFNVLYFFKNVYIILIKN